jgi:hypothetical protein
MEAVIKLNVRRRVKNKNKPIDEDVSDKDFDRQLIELDKEPVDSRNNTAPEIDNNECSSNVNIYLNNEVLSEQPKKERGRPRKVANALTDSPKSPAKNGTLRINS